MDGILASTAISRGHNRLFFLYESVGALLLMQCPAQRKAKALLFAPLQECGHESSPSELCAATTARLGEEAGAFGRSGRQVQPVRLQQELGGTGVASPRSCGQEFCVGYPFAIESKRGGNPARGQEVHCSLRELSRGNASSSLRGAVKQRRWLLLLVLAFCVAQRILAVLEKAGLVPRKSPPCGGLFLRWNDGATYSISRKLRSCSERLG